MATRVRSYSKINLGLAIGPVRDDGFHGLMTLYQTLALHDAVTVEARLLERAAAAGKKIPPLRSGQTNRGGGTVNGRDSIITLTTNHPGVPTDGRNTAGKMVELAL